MAVTVTQVDVWAGEIADEAGALAAVLGAIAEAGGSVECVIARRRGDRAGKGQVFVTPVKGAKVQKAARAAGFLPASDLATLRIETSNKAGIGALVMRAVAESGVNVRGISAVALGNKAVAYVGLDSKADAQKAIKAIRKVG